MHATRSLRKYVSHARFFERSQLRFSQPRALNDPQEARPELLFGKFAPEDYEIARQRATQNGMFGLPDEELETLFMLPFPRRRYDEKVAPGLWPYSELRLRPEPFKTIEEVDQCIAKKAISLSRDFADKNFGILSLSASLEETMWAYYADSHKGLAIEFNPNHPYFVNMRSVEYSDQPIFVSSNFGWVRIGGVRLNSDDVLASNVNSVPDSLLFRKRSHWAHEKEFRLVRSLKDADVDLGPDAIGASICLFNLPAEAVSGLTFGYRAPSSFVKATCDLLENPIWKHVWRKKRVETVNGVVEVSIA